MYWHGIKETSEDTITSAVVNPDRSKVVDIGQPLQRSRRISLTIRHVPKVLKMRLGLTK